MGPEGTDLVTASSIMIQFRYDNIHLRAGTMCLV